MLSSKQTHNETPQLFPHPGMVNPWKWKWHIMELVSTRRADQHVYRRDHGLAPG